MKIYIWQELHSVIVASENKGKEDVFLMKLDKDWNIIWEKQYGTPSWDEAWSMELINSDTELLVSGSNNPDAYLRLYDTNGNLEWNEVFAARGIKAGTGGRHFAVYKNKYIYFTGLHLQIYLAKIQISKQMTHLLLNSDYNKVS